MKLPPSLLRTGATCQAKPRTLEAFVPTWNWLGKLFAVASRQIMPGVFLSHFLLLKTAPWGCLKKNNRKKVRLIYDQPVNLWFTGDVSWATSPSHKLGLCLIKRPPLQTPPPLFQSYPSPRLPYSHDISALRGHWNGKGLLCPLNDFVQRQMPLRFQQRLLFIF